MRGFRYSIASLLLVVGFCGVGFAAVRNASELWAATLFTLTVATLLAAVLLAIYQREQTRTFWMGFALFGGCYLTLSLVPAAAPQLPTTVLIHRFTAPGQEVETVAFSADGRLVASTKYIGEVGLWETRTGRLLSGPGVAPGHLLRVAHSLLALILALLGGMLARFFHATRERHENATPSGGGSPCEHLDSPLPD